MLSDKTHPAPLSSPSGNTTTPPDPALHPTEPHDSSPMEPKKVEWAISTNGNGGYEKQEGDSSTRRDNKGEEGINTGLLDRGSENEGREGGRSMSDGAKMKMKGKNPDTMGNGKDERFKQDDGDEQRSVKDTEVSVLEAGTRDKAINIVYKHPSPPTGIVASSSGSAIVDHGTVVRGNGVSKDDESTGGESEDAGLRRGVIEDGEQE